VTRSPRTVSDSGRAGGVAMAAMCSLTNTRLAFTGTDETQKVACLVKGSEGGLVEALRRAEKD
jgi:hypothetical protein